MKIQKINKYCVTKTHNTIYSQTSFDFKLLYSEDL